MADLQVKIFREPGAVMKTAALSPCGVYRYTLSRIWNNQESPWDQSLLVFVGLNPSIADAEIDDPTIRREMAFAKREGADGIVKLNLYALRSTDPRALATHPDPFGPDNMRGFEYVAKYGSHWRVVAAWGADKMATPEAVSRIAPTLMGQTMPGPNRPLYCLGTTKAGMPRHPLYVKGDAPLVQWRNPHGC